MNGSAPRRPSTGAAAHECGFGARNETRLGATIWPESRMPLKISVLAPDTQAALKRIQLEKSHKILTSKRVRN
jgi:hypothetical protein